MNNVNYEQRGSVYNGETATYIRNLHKAGFGNMSYVIHGAVQEYANGEDEVSDTITLNAIHDSGIKMELRLKFIAKDNDPDYDEDDNEIPFDYTDKDEYFLDEVFVNGVKFIHWDVQDGLANYRLSIDFDQWSADYYKNSIRRWIANGGKFTA